ncbi:hypothetical protein FNT36_13810 [Hymenobacter setariae]|uniref:DUF4476 domain-containing protein n=1 Tax=Hymenobacter setariae TaxID=2594794 RepID=A0A558BVK8_9BACT|nr:hypothetical protein [Hymenobacter setariae]TVT40546.1 hypothetical protein FNT36_13810 [Hymenobacter setariae]
MRTILATLLLAAAALSANAQNIAIKKDLITVDGQPYAHLEQGEAGEYYVSSPQKQRLFLVRPLTLQDPAGWASYLQFVFTDSRKVVETPKPSENFRILSPTKLARIIYSARLLKDGALDPKAVADFEVNYGAPYSERRQALNQLLTQPTVVVPAVAPHPQP